MWYALGVLDGKYKDHVIFTGLVDAMVNSRKCEEQGVELQNFEYMSALDEFAHICTITSPEAYHLLHRHFPWLTIWSFHWVFQSIFVEIHMFNISFSYAKNQMCLHAMIPYHNFQLYIWAIHWICEVDQILWSTGTELWWLEASSCPMNIFGP